MDYLRNIGANKHQRGATGWAQPTWARQSPPWRALVGCGLLGPPPVPIFWYISRFDLENIKGGLSGRSAVASRRNLGRSTFALRWSDSAGELPSRRGKSSSSSSPTTQPSWEGISSSTYQHHQLLSNPSSSLVFNLCTKTIDWCLWVTSSVDYIL